MTTPIKLDPRFDAVHAQALAEGRVLIAVLKSGDPVFSKKGVSHLDAHPSVLPLIPAAFARIDVSEFVGRDLFATVDFGHIVGDRECVETADGDEIVYVRRTGRPGISRMVKGRAGIPCSSVFVVLYLADPTSGLIAVMTAYIGTQVAPEPNSPSGRKTTSIWESACRAWLNRALVWDGKVTDQEFTASDFFGTDPCITSK